MLIVDPLVHPEYGPVAGSSRLDSLDLLTGQLSIISEAVSDLLQFDVQITPLVHVVQIAPLYVVVCAKFQEHPE